MYLIFRSTPQNSMAILPPILERNTPLRTIARIIRVYIHVSPNHSYKLYNYMQYPGTHLFDHWWYLFFVHIMRHMFQASWVKPIVVFIVQQIAQFTRVQIRNLDNV